MKKFSSPLLSKIYILTAVLVTLAIVGVYYILSGNLNGSGEKKAIKVGLILYDEFDPFTNQIASETEKTLSELAYKNNVSINVEVQYSNKSQLRQNDQFAEMIAKDYDVICVNPVDRTDAMQIVDRAKEADIPVIFFNRELVNEDMNRWDKLYYVGADAEQSAIIQANIVVDAFSDETRIDELDFNHDGVIQYVMLEGEAGHQDAISRTDYSVKTLLEQGINLEKLSYQFADWNRGQGENRMSRLIEQYGDEIELVISNNDEMALGAVEAWQKAGYDCRNWPVIFGIDGLDDALEAIKTGKMKGTVYNDKEDQAMELAKLSVEIVCGKDTNRKHLKEGRYYVSEYCRVDSSNVDHFLK